MANIAGIYVVQQDGTVILKREYKINCFILTNDQIRSLKDLCIKQQQGQPNSNSSSSSVFKVPSDLVMKGDNIYSACFIKRNDLYFIAVCLDNQTIGCESMGAMQILRLLIEVIEDTCGLDKMRENFYSLTLVIDTMLDYGFPLITDKSVLVTMLQKTDILHKASNAITGSVSDKHSNAILNALAQINNNANSLWRFNNSESGLDLKASSGQTGNGENTNAFIKDIYVDLIEYAECIFNEQGDQELQEVSGEVTMEAQIPGSKPKVSVKLRFNQELEDFTIHRQCEGRALQTIGNHEFSVSQVTPPMGKFTMVKYINKKFPLQMPFHLKATYNVQSGTCQFDCRFERFALGKDKDGQTIYPAMESIFIKFYFPEEVTSASLTSLPDGIFNFDEREQIGEWTINSFGSASSSETQVKLSGNIRFNDTSINEMPASIVAIVNLKIKEYTFSGSKIERIACNLSGGSTSKDDQSVFKGVKAYSFAKNIEYRL